MSATTTTWCCVLLFRSKQEPDNQTVFAQAHASSLVTEYDTIFQMQAKQASLCALFMQASMCMIPSSSKLTRPQQTQAITQQQHLGTRTVFGSGLPLNKTLYTTTAAMPPAAPGFQGDHSSAHESTTTSFDVFGNDLGDVDIWGDDKADNTTSTVDARNAARDAINISERDSESDQNVDIGLPPRRSSSRGKMPSAELLQKQASRLNRRTRRPSLSDNMNSASGRNVPDSPVRTNTVFNLNLPPMTPRTRGRKLGLPLAPTLAQADPSPPPKAKTLSVAEKRRMRSEELLLASQMALDFHIDADQQTEPVEFTLNGAGAAADHATDLFQNPTSLFDEQVPYKNSEGARHARTFSDSQLAFNAQAIFASTRSESFEHPSAIPSFANNGQEKSNKTQDISVPPRQKVRESRKDIVEDLMHRRAQSLPRKKKSRQKSLQAKIPSDHQEKPPCSTSPKSPRRRTSDFSDVHDELQKHLKGLFSEEQGSPGADMGKSARSGGSKNLQAKIPSDHQEKPPRSTSPKSPRRRTSDFSDVHDELQKHLKGLFSEEQGSPGADMGKSTRSGGSKSSKSRQKSLQGKIPSDNQEKPRRRTSDLGNVHEELQKHLKSIFAAEQGSPVGSMGKSTHSGSTKSTRSGSRRSLTFSKQDSEDVESATPQDSEPPTPGFYRRRREPYQKSRSLGNKVEPPVIRGDSVPRAGEKIRFIRGASPAPKAADISDSKSQGEKSSRSAKSRESTKSSPRSGRRASLEDTGASTKCSTNSSPRRGRISAGPTTRVRSDGKKESSLACPPSPQVADETARSLRARSPRGGRRSSDVSGEPATPRSTTTPRRKIRYTRNSDTDQAESLPQAPSLDGL